jgi:hypothetical protein
MALSAEDQQLVANMRSREFNIKKGNRAASVIAHKSRRRRRVLVFLTALVLACAVAGVFIGVTSVHHGWLTQRWRLKLVLGALGAIIGTLAAEAFWKTRLGRRLLASGELRLTQKYSGDLHAGRRWTPFYYRGEDISSYVLQLLYVLESEQRYDSVPAALEFVKRHQREKTQAQAYALQRLNAVAAQTNAMVLSNVNAQGQVASRVRRFVKTAGSAGTGCGCPAAARWRTPAPGAAGRPGQRR